MAKLITVTADSRPGIAAPSLALREAKDCSKFRLQLIFGRLEDSLIQFNSLKDIAQLESEWMVQGTQRRGRALARAARSGLRDEVFEFGQHAAHGCIRMHGRLSGRLRGGG